MLRFDDILGRVLGYNADCDRDLLQRAYAYTAKLHEGKKRLSGEPSLAHPLEVANILAEMALDDVTIAAGLLHDTAEDASSTVEEIEELFGSEVGFLVGGLTKLSKIEFTSARERQAENFRKMLVAMSKDIRILLIKLADRLHRMRALHSVEKDEARKIAQETLDIYVPLAHRLGIAWMKRELEGLIFRTLEPQAAAELERELRGRHAERERYIEEVKDILDEKLTAADLRGEVSGRVKDLASIHAKMKQQRIRLDEMFDVIAFRIITEGGTETVYAALGMIHATWTPVPGRFKDYVALPKPNGYKSLHTTVIGPYGERMEVQIRTQEMHRDAELGIAAHWRYKGRGGKLEDDEKFAWLRQLLERQGELADPHEFLETIKVDLFPDEVFVFTPKGDVLNLTKGATALDFAYAVHSEVGERCTGAKVNGQMRPLHHRLRDGDTVEVITSASQGPKKDWLEFVVTGKARSRIRQAVRLAENTRSRDIGRGLLERELRKAGLSLNRLLDEQGLDEVARKEARGNVNDLFAAIGYGRVATADVLRALRPEESAEEAAAAEEAAREERTRNLLQQERKEAKSGILVGGEGDVLVRIANCCSPLPGDEIIGFVTRGRGVTIHARDCRGVFELDPERRIEVDWDSSALVSRRTRIRVICRDEPGILAKISKTISSAGVNIGTARMTAHPDQTATQNYELWVADVNTLDQVMREIGRVKGVLSVDRLRA